MLTACVPLFFVPGSVPFSFAFLFGACGFVLFLRGIRPDVFIRFIPERPIQGLPEENRESKAWGIALVFIAAIVIGSVFIHARYVPQDENIAGLIRAGFKNLSTQRQSDDKKPLPQETSNKPTRPRPRPLPISPSADSPELALLKEAESERGVLCGFKEEWRNRGNDLYAMNNHDPSNPNNADATRFFEDNLAADMTQEYLSKYAERANELRLELIAEVPDTQTDGMIEYVKIPQFRTDHGRGRIFMPFSYMQRICGDFSNLVEAFQAKLAVNSK